MSVGFFYNHCMKPLRQAISLQVMINFEKKYCMYYDKLYMQICKISEYT